MDHDHLNVDAIKARRATAELMADGDSAVTRWAMSGSDADLDPLPEPPAWYAQAACVGRYDAGEDPWFPERGTNPHIATAICEGCPVRDPCLDYAIAERLDYGVWGGLGPGARKALAKAQRAGRDERPDAA
ncbi:MAG: WhiB family transcriptional regulator [Nitriliruptoraceae bacterium]|nr:WhiB family transcriptional regulator [Nitriliruptoraceae bacterium]